jgi:UDP-3-O-[3-hydroxymyristoyl] glucosamine N-acyltransferase
MRLTLSQIADLVGGAVHGDGALVVEGAAGLAEATEKDITFLGNAKYTSLLKTTRAAAVLAPPDVDLAGRPAVVLKNPPYGWAKILEIIAGEKTKRPAGVHPTAVVAPGAKVAPGASLGAHVVVEEGASVGEGTVVYAHGYIGRGSRVGAGCLLHPRVTILDGVSVGDRCILHSGVVIGSDGFGFTFHQGRHYKIPQVGGVDIGDDVEIQANSTVDRAAAGVTRIGRGTKIDNLVQVAHNVEIGEHCLIVALTGIAGSVKIGNYATLAAQVGVAGHLTIGEGAIIGARGGVSHDIGPKEVVWGVPAQPLKKELKMQAAMRKLPEVLEELKKFKKMWEKP